jgi:hypothetical protein
VGGEDLLRGGDVLGEVLGETEISDEFALEMFTIVAVSSETEKVVVEVEVEVLGLIGNINPCDPPPRFASTSGEGRLCFELRESTRVTVPSGWVKLLERAFPSW